MADIRVTKIEAARRQIDTAIRQLFSGEDALAIHTVAAAAHTILRNIADKTGISNWQESIKNCVRPEKIKEFWKAHNESSNFLKHADTDPAGILEFGEVENDLTLIACCSLYCSLGYEATMEMRAFSSWTCVTYPHLFFDGWLDANLPRGIDRMALDRMRGLPRPKLLKLGKHLLSVVRQSEVAPFV